MHVLLCLCRFRYESFKLYTFLIIQTHHLQKKDGISLNVMDTKHRKFVPFDIGFFLILILNNNGTNVHALH